MTASDLKDKIYGWDQVAVWTSLARSGILFGCIIVVFGRYRKLRKQNFVIAIWVLFGITGVVFVVNAIISIKLLNAVQDHDLETARKLKPYWVETVIFYEVTSMSAHWIFAIKYIEVVLKLPLLFASDRRQDDKIEVKRKHISCTILTLNVLFCVIVIAICIVEQLFIYGTWDRDPKLDAVNFLLPSAIILPSVVLLVAVIKLHCIVSKMVSKAVFEKEKLIFVHSLVFGLFCLFSITGILCYELLNTEQKTSENCKVYLVFSGT